MNAAEVLARLLSGVPVAADDIEPLAEPDRTIVQRVANANGAGPITAFYAAIEELLPGPAERNNYIGRVFASDPGAEPCMTARARTSDGEQPHYTVHWANEALQPQPPIEWLVDQLFSAGSVSLVVGEGGSKKTWCMLDAAICVAQGADWLGHATRQAAALIVDEESGPRRLAQRLGEIMRAHDADAATPVAYVSLAGFNLREPATESYLRELMHKTGAQFVVIDALADVMAGGDENAVKDTQPVFMAFRRLAEEFQAAFVVIHHTGKDGNYRGSSALKGAVDLLLKVTSRPQSTTVNFSIEKARDVESSKFSATITFEPGRTIVTSTAAGLVTSAATKQVTSTVMHLKGSKLYVLRYLFEHGPSLLSDVKLHADKCSKNAARQAVYDLRGLDLVRRTDSGGTGAEATYGLTNKGVEQARQEAACGDSSSKMGTEATNLPS